MEAAPFVGNSVTCIYMQSLFLDFMSMLSFENIFVGFFGRNSLIENQTKIATCHMYYHKHWFNLNAFNKTSKSLKRHNL